MTQKEDFERRPMGCSGLESSSAEGESPEETQCLFKSNPDFWKRAYEGLLSSGNIFQVAKQNQGELKELGIGTIGLVRGLYLYMKNLGVYNPYLDMQTVPAERKSNPYDKIDHHHY